MGKDVRKYRFAQGETWTSATPTPVGAPIDIDRVLRTKQFQTFFVYYLYDAAYVESSISLILSFKTL